MRIYKVTTNINEGHELDAEFKRNKDFKTFELMLAYVDELIQYAVNDGYTVEGDLTNELSIKEKMDLMLKPGGAGVQLDVNFDDWPDAHITIDAVEVL